MERCCIVRPPGRAPRGIRLLEAPPSKSVALRALVAAAVAGGGHLRIDGALPRDVERMIAGLRALGHTVERESRAVVVGGFRPSTGALTLDAGDGAATARFLLALAARGSVPVTVDGSRRLRERPMLPLLEAFVSLGVEVEGGPGLPVTVRGPLTRSGEIVLDGSLSSQFCSALLLALPGCGLDVRLRVEGEQVSAPYVTLTREVLAHFGVDVSPELGVGAEARARPASLDVEGDWSAGTVLLSAAAFLGEPVRVTGLALASPQPDRRFVEVARELGLSVEDAGGAVLASGGVARGGHFDLSAFPDAAPAVAALGALAPEPVLIEGVPHLRHKESDRIEGLVALLKTAGARAEAREDGLLVQAGSLPPEPAGLPLPLDVRGDHRLAMAAALLGLLRPVRIPGADCVEKSFPRFFDAWPGASWGA